MTWRVAKSLLVLRAQIDALAPHRGKSNDGTIGDESHQSRTSDHNPWIIGVDGVRVVSAMDITHDPAHGLDSYALAELLRQRRDWRIKFLISNRRITSAIEEPWQWRPYHGPNPHDHHVHVSVLPAAAERDNEQPWNLDGFDAAMASHPPAFDAVASEVAGLPQLRLHAAGADVASLQTMLNQHGASLTVDGVFGAAMDTAVRAFQLRAGLAGDGIVGGYTWRALKAGLA